MMDLEQKKKVLKMSKVKVLSSLHIRQVRKSSNLLQGWGDLTTKHTLYSTSKNADKMVTSTSPRLKKNDNDQYCLLTVTSVCWGLKFHLMLEATSALNLTVTGRSTFSMVSILDVS